jgi:hypothetical protein
MPVRPDVSGSNDDQKELLTYYADLIERKFREGRLHDVDPEQIQNIIQVLKVTNPGNNKSAQDLLQDIEFSCYATLRYYRDDKYEPYMKRLRTIAKQIKNLIRKLK